jgi:prepilin-type N-terminal cleavage/methylation domain-containing protein
MNSQRLRSPRPRPASLAVGPNRNRPADETQLTTDHASRITRHASRITHHASRVTHHASRFAPRHPSRASRHLSRAFTLIELLVVISIIAILAALIFPVVSVVNRTKLRTRARGELVQIQSFIDGYKAKLGHYPPDNPGQPGLNQLYYELAGTTNNGPASVFGTLDHNAAIAPVNITGFFGPPLAGFVNSTKAGAGDESRSAQKFLHDLKPLQVGDVTRGGYAGPPVKVLLCTVPGVDPNAASPLVDLSGRPVTVTSAPWCYNSSSPTNNTTTYDLWADILIAGKTNRICNWSSQALINP